MANTAKVSGAGIASFTYKQVISFLKSTVSRHRQLPILAKLTFWFVILVVVALVSAFFIIGPDKIAQTLYDLSQRLAELRFGWLILGAVLVITSFPPLVGYFTTVSLCGFAYGLQGFFIAAPAAVFGSALVFIVLRLAFMRKIRSWTAENDKWQALERVIKSRGLPLIILIRLSPIPPWVYANALFASIEAVSLWQFMFATTCLLPKIFVIVFVGSRLALLSDGKQRGQMDTMSKIIDSVSIVVGVLLAIATGVVVFRLMRKEIRELRESPNVDDELAADALEEAEEGAPLLGNISESDGRERAPSKYNR